LKFTIDDTIAERNEVVHHWTGKGTHKGQFLGMQPTNKHATVSGTSIYRIDKGKIAEEWVDWNLMTMMEQLGVGAPAKAEARQHA
jgi:predicted ester cyclase